MVAYTTASGNVEAALEGRTLVVVEKSSAGWLWKVSTALLVLALCAGGVLLFAWYWHGKPQTMMWSGQTEALIEKDQAEKIDHHKALKRIGSNAKAAIHLEGFYNDSTGSPSQLEWKNERGQAFVQGGFRLLNNRIMVPQTGLYFVYSQASFHVLCGDGNERGAARHPTWLSHRILRYSDSVGADRSLVSAVRSACQQAAQDGGRSVENSWYNTIYLGAVFRLYEGDTLWTETNQLAELEINDGKTFFGVFAL